MRKIIRLQRLNDSEIIINAELIESVESTPDTVVTLTSSHRVIVKNPVDEVIEKVLNYKRKINCYPE